MSERKIDARLEDVGIRYGPKVVLQHLSLDIVEGAITCIIGLSGAGKSTILRLVNGLRRPDEGRVLLGDRDISALDERELISIREKIGFSFQFAALFDSLSIYDNVALPLRERTKMPEAKIRELVEETLESVGLAQVIDRFPAELSGGMVKRAGFARAVISNPECVLYDEPTTGLDPIMGAVIDGLIVDCVKRLGSTAVAITHDMASARRIGDTAAMIHRGKIVWSGPASALMDSGNPEVDQFTHGRREGPIQMELRR
jgi:phospholipid/cholesterol/gamma-HCH transport system ATP-binding protein